MTAWGPYETGGQVQADSADLRTAEEKLGRLLRVCRRSGVELAHQDWRILSWLARWEPETVQVVAGLISRAYAAGAEGGGGDQRD